ncbi:MAG TPA: glycosyltransferase [Candidatus Limnocylindrales bacterium]
MTPRPAARIAIVHDYVTQQGGAERLVGEMVRLLPGATFHTSVIDQEQIPDTLRGTPIRTTPLQRVYARGVPLTALAPVLPTAFGRIRLGHADVVVSSTTAFAHHVRPPTRAVHVAYCHAPPHFLWNTTDYFRGRETMGRLAEPALALARRSDLAAARRVDVFVANSRYTADRIGEVYGRDAVVVHPPIDTAAFEPTTDPPGSFLVVARLRRHKRLDLAVEAATQHDWPLDVIGEGPDEAVLREAAGPTVRFLGRRSDAEVRAAMARCIALLVPGTEDFGMTMAEVQAAGRPPVAFARGGALEIVDDGATGFLFRKPTVEALAAAMTRAVESSLETDDLVASARRFDRSIFDAGLLGVLEDARSCSAP